MQKEPSSQIKIPSFEVKDTGIIKQVKEGIVRIAELTSVINGQLLDLGKNLKGIVIGFNKEEVLSLVLGDEKSLNIGDIVSSEEGVFEIPVGENFISRIVNAFGQPIDERGKIESSSTRPIFSDAPAVLDRIPITEQLLTGIKMIDTMIPIGKGQRELIIGDRVTGKTSLATDVISNQKDKNVICIFCWVGGSYSSFLKLIQEFKREDCLDYSIVVSALASDSPAEQYLVPYSACSLGEYFMRRGRDVLIVYDNLTRHAWIYRQLSLLLERSPGREAYPGDIFYLHSQLMERAGRLNEENGSGSMTFLPIIETQEGDVTGLIPSNLISMTDGQIYLGSGLFHEGFKPAVDLGLSVSRIGNKVQSEAIKEVSRFLKSDYTSYKELASITKIRTKLSEEVEARMKKGDALREFFIQAKDNPVTSEEMIVIFYSLSKEFPELLDPAKRSKFKKEIYIFLSRNYPKIIEKLTIEKVLTAEIKQGLDEAFKEFFK